MVGILTFRFRAYEFYFRALESVYFPANKAGNVLRGAMWPRLGPLCGDVPVPLGRFADPPRPFVIRAAHLNGKTFAPGESFSVGLNLFDTSPRWVNAIMQSLEAWGATGLGPGRGRVEVLTTWVAGKDVTIDLNRSSIASRCTVQFVTPTELKGDPAGQMPFGTLYLDYLGTNQFSVLAIRPSALANGFSCHDRTRPAPLTLLT